MRIVERIEQPSTRAETTVICFDRGSALAIDLFYDINCSGQDFIDDDNYRPKNAVIAASMLSISGPSTTPAARNSFA